MNYSENLRLVAAAAAVILTGCATGALAQEAAAPEAEATDNGYPFVSGDFWEVTGIEILPGGGLDYAHFLADKWITNQEFAISQGWIKDYQVLSNYHARDGEPDLYLISVFEGLPTGPEDEARFEAYQAWAATSVEVLVSENQDRADIRRIMSTSLLQELNLRD